MTIESKRGQGPQSDQELVQYTLEGDRNAYRVLVERYQARLLTMAFNILKNREDAEDVVQESFVKGFLSLKYFKGHSSFYTWLYRITFNMAVDVKRRAISRGGKHFEFKESWGVNNDGSGAGQGASSPTITQDIEHLQNVEGPQAVLLRKELGGKLQVVLSQLSEEHRAVITLREVDGLDYQEIAAAIGVRRGTVMSRLLYARKALQNALKELSPEGAAASSSQELAKVR